MPISVGDSRTFFRGVMATSMADVMETCQRGMIDYTFLGGAQIDAYGNLNSTVIGPDYRRPKVRLPGSGGANDIISLCRSVIILTVHERRRFSDALDFVTSPGWLKGGDARRKSGLLFGGVGRVVTTLGVFGFDAESRHMRLEALHTGVTVDEVKANTGFEVLVSDALTTTKPPTDEELGILRALDPARQFL